MREKFLCSSFHEITDHFTCREKLSNKSFHATSRNGAVGGRSRSGLYPGLLRQNLATWYP